MLDTESYIYKYLLYKGYEEAFVQAYPYQLVIKARLRLFMKCTNCHNSQKVNVKLPYLPLFSIALWRYGIKMQEVILESI